MKLRRTANPRLTLSPAPAIRFNLYKIFTITRYNSTHLLYGGIVGRASFNSLVVVKRQGTPLIIASRADAGLRFDGLCDVCDAPSITCFFPSYPTSISRRGWSRETLPENLLK
jgi:hypothetical protein